MSNVIPPPRETRCSIASVRSRRRACDDPCGAPCAPHEANAVAAATNAAVARAEAANAQADLTSSEALIAHLKLAIEKLRRELYGTRSERTARLLDQMELQLEDLEAAATEDELAQENAAERTLTVKSFQRKRPSRKPFPDHLPGERVVIAVPESCPAGRRSCRSWVRTSPRRSRSSCGDGR
jgi:hypothetical protein